MRTCRTTVIFLLILPASALAADQEEARALVDKALKAMGGEAKLARFKAATWKATGSYHGIGQTVAYSGAWTVQPPGQARIAVSGELRGQKFSRLLVINGDKGWTRLNDATESLDKETLLEEKERLHANWVATLLPLKSKAFELFLLEDKRVGERIVAGVKVVHSGHRDVSLYFDKQTGLLVQSESRLKDPQRETEIVQEVHYSDYREVQGVRRAMKIVVRWDRKKHAEAILSDFKALEHAEESVFVRPE